MKQRINRHSEGVFIIAATPFSGKWRVRSFKHRSIGRLLPKLWCVWDDYTRYYG